MHTLLHPELAHPRMTRRNTSTLLPFTPVRSHIPTAPATLLQVSPLFRCLTTSSLQTALNPIAAQVLVWNERQQTLTNTICHSLLDGRNVEQGIAHLDKPRSLCCFYTILIWLHTTEMYLLPPAACFSKDPFSFLLLSSPPSTPAHVPSMSVTNCFFPCCF